MRVLITDISTSKRLQKKKIGFTNSYNWYKICPSIQGTGLRRNYYVLGSLTYIHTITGERVIEIISAWDEKDLRQYQNSKEIKYRWFELTSN